MCIAVTVYNLAKGRGVTVGDSVAIPEPCVIHHKFSYLDNVSIIVLIYMLLLKLTVIQLYTFSGF